jgi:hypothetical protein
MATSLGEAYSILGSAQGAEFKRRREEEEKARKDARRDQYISYIAAPLITGASEALISGATEVASNIFLGDNAKKYFETEQGRIIARQAKAADKIEQRLTKQIDQLSTGGRSPLDTLVLQATADFKTELERTYGADAKNAVIINKIISDSQDIIYTTAQEKLDMLTKVRDYAAVSPDVDVLKERAADTTQFFGKSAGKKLLSTWAGKLTGKDPAAVGAKYILTGSTKFNEEDDELFTQLQEGGYMESLTEQIKKLEGFNNGRLTNAVASWQAKNPGIDPLLKGGQFEEAVASLQDSADLAALSGSNPEIAAFLNTTDGKDVKNPEQLQQALVKRALNISPAETKGLVNMYIARPDGRESMQVLETITASSLFNVEGSPEAIKKDTDKYIEIQKSSQAFVTDTLMPQFAYELQGVLSKLSPAEVAKINPATRTQLAYDYINYQINNNLINEPEIEKSWYQSNEPARMERVFKEPTAGIDFIKNSLGSVETLAERAKSSGAGRDIAAVTSQKIAPFYVSLEEDEFNNQFSFVKNPVLPNDLKIKAINEGFDALYNTLNEQAIRSGYKDKDGNPNLSPQLIEQLEEKRNNYLKLFD